MYKAPVSLPPVTLGESGGLFILGSLSILFSCLQGIALPDILFCLLLDLVEGGDLLL